MVGRTRFFPDINVPAEKKKAHRIFHKKPSSVRKVTGAVSLLHKKKGGIDNTSFLMLLLIGTGVFLALREMK
jgi:hypothetical protein